MKLEPIQSCTFSGLHSSIFLFSLSSSLSLSSELVAAAPNLLIFPLPITYYPSLSLSRLLRLLMLIWEARMPPSPPFPLSSREEAEAGRRRRRGSRRRRRSRSTSYTWDGTRKFFFPNFSAFEKDFVISLSLAKVRNTLPEDEKVKCQTFDSQQQKQALGIVYFAPIHAQCSPAGCP